MYVLALKRDACVRLDNEIAKIDCRLPIVVTFVAVGIVGNGRATNLRASISEAGKQSSFGTHKALSVICCKYQPWQQECQVETLPGVVRYRVLLCFQASTTFPSHPALLFFPLEYRVFTQSQTCMDLTTPKTNLWRLPLQSGAFFLDRYTINGRKIAPPTLFKLPFTPLLVHSCLSKMFQSGSPSCNSRRLINHRSSILLISILYVGELPRDSGSIRVLHFQK